MKSERAAREAAAPRHRRGKRSDDPEGLTRFWRRDLGTREKEPDSRGSLKTGGRARFRRRDRHGRQGNRRKENEGRRARSTPRLDVRTASARRIRSAHAVFPATGTAVDGRLRRAEGRSRPREEDSEDGKRHDQGPTVLSLGLVRACCPAHPADSGSSARRPRAEESPNRGDCQRRHLERAFQVAG